jgi:hypothetical protein
MPEKRPLREEGKKEFVSKVLGVLLLISTKVFNITQKVIPLML